MKKQKVMILIVLLACISLVGIRWMNARSRPPHNPGQTNGVLAPCPDRPNCVCTRTDNREQHMPAWALSESSDVAIDKIAKIIKSMPRTRIISADGSYLHAEFRSLIFGFVDDVEFAVDEPQKQIHFRSASRVGYSDFGANRKRMEEISRRYKES